MWLMRSLVEGGWLLIQCMASPMGKSWGTVSAARLRNGTDVGLDAGGGFGSWLGMRLPARGGMEVGRLTSPGQDADLSCAWCVHD